MLEPGVCVPLMYHMPYFCVHSEKENPLIYCVYDCHKETNPQINSNNQILWFTVVVWMWGC
jgi:hypothetical protein